MSEGRLDLTQTHMLLNSSTTTVLPRTQFLVQHASTANGSSFLNLRETTVDVRSQTITLDGHNSTILRGRANGVVVVDKCKMLGGLDARGGAITLFGESDTVVDASGSVILGNNGTTVSDLPCNVRREGGQSLAIGGPSLVISEGNACNPL